MRDEDDQPSWLVPVPPLSQALAQRTLGRAKAHLPTPSQAVDLRWLPSIPSAAVPAALISADLAFAVDACVKIGRAFGS